MATLSVKDFVDVSVNSINLWKTRMIFDNYHSGPEKLIPRFSPFFVGMYVICNGFLCVLIHV